MVAQKLVTRWGVVVGGAGYMALCLEGVRVLMVLVWEKVFVKERMILFMEGQNHWLIRDVRKVEYWGVGLVRKMLWVRKRRVAR